MARCLRGGTTYKRHQYTNLAEDGSPFVGGGSICKACGKVKNEKLSADRSVSGSQSPDEGSL